MKEHVIVFKGRIARNLLKLGYRIIDIKPDKENTDRTIFVFKNEGNFESDFVRLSH